MARFDSSAVFRVDFNIRLSPGLAEEISYFLRSKSPFTFSSPQGSEFEVSFSSLRVLGHDLIRATCRVETIRGGLPSSLEEYLDVIVCVISRDAGGPGVAELVDVRNVSFPADDKGMAA